MRRSYVVAAAMLTLASTQLQAGIKFAAYEGPDAVQTGRGGTKISAHGIDYWTSGSPPRQFQVIGIISDERDDRPITRLFGGEAVGSKGVAKKVLQAGGHAVILIDQSDRDGGVFGYVTSDTGLTTFGGRRVTVTKTQMLVVRYLP